jgi:hypothetical protein
LGGLGEDDFWPSFRRVNPEEVAVNDDPDCHSEEIIFENADMEDASPEVLKRPACLDFDAVAKRPSMKTEVAKRPAKIQIETDPRPAGSSSSAKAKGKAKAAAKANAKAKAKRKSSRHPLKANAESSMVIVLGPVNEVTSARLREAHFKHAALIAIEPT